MDCHSLRSVIDHLLDKSKLNGSEYAINDFRTREIVRAGINDIFGDRYVILCKDENNKNQGHN